MTDDERTPQTPFLKRWSQRKLAASREPSTPIDKAASNVAAAPAVVQPTASQAVEVQASPPLPPVESLSFDSDFSAFLQPDVDETLKRQALRKLFADPRFNVMDGLDVYIDDYNKFEPMTPELVAQLNHAKFLFDPPKTRVNEQGYVEDVPDEPTGEAGAETAADGTSVDAAAGPIVDNATSLALADSPELPAIPAAPPAPEKAR